MTDLLANPDCKLCHGTGMIRERRPDYWGMPAYEWITCDCYEPMVKAIKDKPVGLGKHIRCQQCEWVGTESELIMPFSGWPPSCPDCWHDDFLEEEEEDETDRT